MPMSFQSSVAVPGGASYSAPLLDFSDVGNWGKNFIAGSQAKQQQGITDQQKQLNDQHIADEKRKADIAQTFSGGLPRDSQGNIDYQRAVAMLAQKGDIGSLSNLAPQVQQQQAVNRPMSPMWGDGASTGQPSGQPPASVAAPPMRPATPGSGDAGSNTIASMVTDKLPNQDATTGQTIAKVAQTMGLDPNANLTPGQIRRAQGLVQKYAPADAAGGGGDLPPSANAIAPKPPASSAPPSAAAAQPAPQGAPIGAGAPQQQGAPPAQVVPQPQPSAPVNAQPQQPQGPIVPQVPLPKGFTDPQAAILALNREASRLARQPGGKEEAKGLQDWAQRIEDSIKPVEMSAGRTLLDPKTGKVIFGSPSAGGGQAGQLVRLENSERAQRGERPMSAQEEISFIQGIHPPRSAPAMAVEAFRKDFQEKNGRAPTGEEITKFAANYSGEQSYGRTAGSQGARVENASNEVEQLIPQAVEASRNYTRQGGKYVGLNKLFQSYDQGTSDPKYNDFVLANFSLINAYTRAMNPQGVPRIQERLEQHAMGILSTATDEKAYEVQIRRLWKEVQASKTATAKTAEGRSPGDINSPVPGLDAGKSNAGGKTSSDGWTVHTLPDGSKARVQEVVD